MSAPVIGATAEQLRISTDIPFLELLDGALDYAVGNAGPDPLAGVILALAAVADRLDALVHVQSGEHATSFHVCEDCNEALQSADRARMFRENGMCGFDGECRESFPCPEHGIPARLFKAGK